MAQPDGDGNGDARRAQIRARLAEIQAELASLTRELEQGEDPEAARRRRKAEWRVLKGGGALMLLGLLLGASRAWEWTVRHARLVSAAVATAGAAAVVAGALLTHGSPVTPGGGGARPPGAAPTVTAGVPALSPAPVVPQPSRSRGVPGVPPVIVPVRSRRPAGATSSPAGPTPTPQPSPTPSPRGPSPSMSPSRCPVGFTLVVLSTGVTVCV